VDTKFHEVALGDPTLVRERKMMSAGEAAQIGYQAMMNGKPVVIPGFKQSVLAFASRFVSREMVVKSARKIQEKKNYRET